MNEAHFETNRELWETYTPRHVESDFYDADGFIGGRSTLRGFELAELGDVAGRDLVHLQCHFGLDTLSWARHHGANVWGLDFSPEGVAAARRTAERAGVDAEFVCANVYDAVDALGRDFDVVYTGLGALNWLPDLDKWAQVVAALLRPGGIFYISEFHPLSNVFAVESLEIEFAYFGRPDQPVFDPDHRSYAAPDSDPGGHPGYEWDHPMGAILTSLIDAGLVIELVKEHDFTLFRRWPFLELADDGTFRMPAGRPTLPLMFSLRARKPADSDH